MGEPLNVGTLDGWTSKRKDFCTIEATCVTGFEKAAKSEVQDKLKVEEVIDQRGRILFDLPISDVTKVLELRTVDNVFVLMSHVPKFDVSGTTEEALERLNTHINDINWEKGLAVWQEVYKFPGSVWPPAQNGSSESKEPESKSPKLDEPDNPVPKFRCTCYRTGTGHKFSSMDAARSMGGVVQDKFKWTVKMKDFDIEFVVNIDIEHLYTTLALTKESLFRRTITHFGPTTLRATICSSLLKYADIKPGDIVVDPMCGGGSIPLEGAIAYNQGFHLGGDYHEKAYQRARDNLKALQTDGKDLPTDIVAWDVTCLPLRDNSVDVFVTDMPFGKRSGSKADNRVLYPKTMLAMARVVRPKTGRAIVLTQDKTSMFKSMPKFKDYWKCSKHTYANIGGLAALVFFMHRTELTVKTEAL